MDWKNHFMLEALKQAEIAFKQNEVPVGCVIVDKNSNKILTHGRNMMQSSNNPNSHAEIIAINNACEILQSKNLSHCDLYVTLEPCTMCAAAIANARIDSLYYSLDDPKHGAIENGVRFFTTASAMHKINIYSGIYSDQSQKLLIDFFRNLRRNRS